MKLICVCFEICESPSDVDSNEWLTNRNLTEGFGSKRSVCNKSMAESVR
jgi:hypothetical protein